MQLEFNVLKEESQISEFTCGESELDLYLKNLALLFQQRRFGITIVFLIKKTL